MRTVAALFVDEEGFYAKAPGVQLWGPSRDALLYNGPHPVVAHPPCARWCQLASVVEKRWGYPQREDGGLFESALRALRRWGGVLEHPAYSMAFAHFGIPTPTAFGWQRTIAGEWVAHVEQQSYGHRAQKATWLLANGVSDPPELLRPKTDEPEAVIGFCLNRSREEDPRPRLRSREASATPSAFGELLLGIARSSRC